MINNKPIYPVYIISKNRSDSMLTSKALCKMKLSHFIAIEPQDEYLYKQAIVNFNLNEFVTLLILPFSNHGDGPGRARNWCWEHSIMSGADKHWVLDDNIHDFYRLHNNRRIRVRTSAIFKAAEDFIERYENVPISGFQYKFFAIPDKNSPAILLNSRVYSCLLIDNKCKYRWRGRYNEDTDICLRVLKDGDCTVQFNTFLQDKAGTQTIKGGNTSEFYHAEGSLDKWNRHYNVEGTINKSQMLVNLHPDVASIVFKFGRWHHHVDYSSFRNNKLRFKSDYNFEKIMDMNSNEYGMKLRKVNEQ